jgi:hypothetical protein
VDTSPSAEKYQWISLIDINTLRHLIDVVELSRSGNV